MLCSFLFDLVARGELSVELVVEKNGRTRSRTSSVLPSAAMCAKVTSRIWSSWTPDQPYAVSSGNLLSKCHWSPFEGHTFMASIDTTIINGTVVYRDGALTGEVAGRRLDFTRAR